MTATFFRTLLLLILTTFAHVDGSEATFRVGFAQRDMTPPVPTPMWGYGARKDKLSEGTLDPLMAKAIVIEASGDRLALVGLDMGRAPTTAMMEQIRSSIREKAQIEHVLIVGSHTHHGPVFELSDREGFGKGKFDAAIGWLKTVPEQLSETIIAAAASLKPARMGISTTEVPYNRNRHTKQKPPARDPFLAVMRFDDTDGKPLAVLVNFAAHPVMTDSRLLKFSADYPGFLMNTVEEKIGCPCVFMQGASGDLSVNPVDVSGPEAFGKKLGGECAALASTINTETPAHPSLKGRVDRFRFSKRIDLSNPAVMFAYSQAFFPELIQNFVEEYRDGIQPELNTVMLNREIALVGGSGEFFSNHAVRLRERSYVKHTLFFGCCNGYMNYFPTIEAVSEGGYGADVYVSPVEVGAGEQMMNRALTNIYVMLGKIAEGKQTTVKPEE